jgi:hypothetical protein
MTVVPGSERHLAFTDSKAAIAELNRRSLDIATTLPVPDAPAAPVEDGDYVPLSRRSAGYRAAMSLRNQGRRPVPLADDGTPVPGVCWADAEEYWEANPQASAGSLAGEAEDLLCASFSPTVWEAFKEFATRRPQTREQRLADRINQLGVPGSGACDDWDINSPVEDVGHVLDPAGFPLQVMQVLPRHRPAMIGRVSVGQRAADRAVEGLAAPVPAVWRWLAWSWPREHGPWHIEPGSLTRTGEIVEAALPSEGAIITRNGITWRVANQPGLTLPAAPAWVARLLAGR